MMTRTFTIIISAIVLASAPSFDARCGEKVVLSTDRTVYVAGDRLLCSAFCLDESGSLSAGSGVAYVEVHNTSGMVQTAKIALSGGRGACGVDLPRDIPTGNYAVLAYTASGCADGVIPDPVVISVFNTASSERVKNGVKILPRGKAGTPAVPQTLPEGIDIRMEGDSMVVLLNTSGRGAALSIALSRQDGIPSPSGASAEVSWPQGRKIPTIPEYEGEIIEGKVVGLDPTQLERLQGKSVFISAPGGTADIYSAPLKSNGTFCIFTSNLFGRTDLVCEVENMPSGMAGHVELESPFVDWEVSSITPLGLCEDWADDLEKRNFASQVERLFELDRLDRHLEFHRGWDFGDEAIVYELEDYTRFPTMKEVFTEFIPEIRWHGNDRDGYSIAVRAFDAYGNAHYSEGSSLMMVDGIPVFDKGRIIDYDPLLVKTIRIYPYQYFLGERSFEGVVDFITYKRNAPGLTFDADVRVVDWDGTGVPFTVQSALDATGPGIPDYRQTVLWQPLLHLAPGERLSFPLPEGLPVVISVKGLSL